MERNSELPILSWRHKNPRPLCTTRYFPPFNSFKVFCCELPRTGWSYPNCGRRRIAGEFCRLICQADAEHRLFWTSRQHLFLLFQTAFFSPVGNGLAYIQKNNIYYRTLPNLPTIVTSDGVEGVVYNGIPDWVYEEEVLGTDAASWFSPDGRYLAFIKFNDTQVREAVYELYSKGNPEETLQYPEEIYLRYPKVRPIVVKKYSKTDNAAFRPALQTQQLTWSFTTLRLEVIRTWRYQPQRSPKTTSWELSFGLTTWHWVLFGWTDVRIVEFSFPTTRQTFWLMKWVSFQYLQNLQIIKFFFY